MLCLCLQFPQLHKVFIKISGFSATDGKQNADKE